MRITTKAILEAVSERIAACVPAAEHYIGRLEQGFRRPAFLYLPIFRSEKKANYFTGEKRMELQIIYFGSKDGYDRIDYTEQLELETALEPFFSQPDLVVGDRSLHFTYEWKEADGQPAFYLIFRFLDEALDQRYLEREKRKAADSIGIEMRVKSNDP